MQSKMIEIRDRMTFIPALAIKLMPVAGEHRAVELWLLRTAGYAEEQLVGNDELPPYILLMKLDGDRVQHDPYAWGDRTYAVVHNFLIENWDHVKSGDVLDVEYILGEVTKPKQSERESERHL